MKLRDDSLGGGCWALRVQSLVVAVALNSHLPLLQEFSLGEWSCLHVVLDLIDSQQQDRYWCPPLLHRAAIAFLHALWQDRRDSAMLVLRTK